MSYGTALGLTLPTINGVATEAQAAPLINTALQAMISRLEGKVTPAGMSITSDLTMRTAGVSYGLTNAHRLGLYDAVTSLSANAYPAAVYQVGGNLYYNDTAGNQIQITSGGTVNVSAAGGITGSGYGSGSVEVNWDAVNTRYRMRSGSATDAYASVILNDVLFNDGSGNTARLGVSGMAADYVIALPTALPASGTHVVTLTSAGTMSHTRALTADSLTLTDDGHVTVGGTGQYKHGTKRRTLPWTAYRTADQTHWSLAAANGYTQQAGTSSLFYALPLEDGEELLGVTVKIRASSAETMTMTVYNASGGTATSVATDASALVEAAEDLVYSAAVGFGSTATSTNGHYIVLSTSGYNVASVFRVYQVSYTYRRG